MQKNIITWLFLIFLCTINEISFSMHQLRKPLAKQASIEIAALAPQLKNIVRNYTNTPNKDNSNTNNFDISEKIKELEAKITSIEKEIKTSNESNLYLTWWIFCIAAASMTRGSSNEEQINKTSAQHNSIETQLKDQIKELKNEISQLKKSDK